MNNKQHKPDLFAPSARAQALLRGENANACTETRSTLFAAVARTLGFPVHINVATEVLRGSPTGRRRHIMVMPQEHKMVCFDGTTHALRSNGLQTGLKVRSEKGRLCYLDDVCPEHPALYAAQAILNYRAVQRAVHEGAPLYQFTWKHTKRTSLINDDRHHPYAYLLDEISVGCGQLMARSDFALVSDPRTPTTMELDGASDKEVTGLIPQAVAMSTIGFELVPHIVDKSQGRSLFVLSKEAVCSTTCLIEGDGIAKERKWTARELLELMVGESKMGRNNAMEDVDPEHPLMYGAFAIMSLEDIIDTIRRGPAKGQDQIMLRTDKALMHAYLGENNRDAMDRLRKMFRRSGRFADKPKLT